MVGGGWGIEDPAALKVNMKIKINYPPDPGRNRATTADLRKKMAVRTLPREVAAKINIKTSLNTIPGGGGRWLGDRRLKNEAFSAELTGPRKLLRIRLGIVDC